ncbi:hypothetical protein CPB84DRAFT_1850972 [Gymnopilus junonius]|uniref:Uncharacterized protein n=1 Tax=Gymnopilus junonius TaxID=109634 RepID=A0A9P5NH84_GYMJU|nr:hypothetical protein CPB84DRAFT_1850972 [Gymnopilus junonius]
MPSNVRRTRFLAYYFNSLTKLRFFKTSTAAVHAPLSEIRVWLGASVHQLRGVAPPTPLNTSSTSADLSPTISISSASSAGQRGSSSEDPYSATLRRRNTLDVQSSNASFTYQGERANIVTRPMLIFGENMEALQNQSVSPSSLVDEDPFWPHSRPLRFLFTSTFYILEAFLIILHTIHYIPSIHLAYM